MFGSIILGLIDLLIRIDTRIQDQKSAVREAQLREELLAAEKKRRLREEFERGRP